MPYSFQELFSNDDLLDLSEEQEKQLSDIEEQAVNKYTAKQTRNHVEELKRFLLDNHLPNSIGSMPQRYLCQYLRLWFCSMKKKNGDLFSLQSLACKRASIHRHILESAGYPVIGNENCQSFEKTYAAVRHKILTNTKKGCSSTTGYQPIEKEDLAKLDTYFDRSTPSRLQQEVFFNIVFHNGFRGREWIRNLKKGDIHVSTGPDALKYVEIVKPEQEKNVKSSDSRNLRQIAMFEIENKSKCPVAAIELYLRKLPESGEVLFPKPKSKWNDLEYYCEREVLGKNTLNDFMKTISREARLSKVYTNHCIRVSLVTWLKENDVPNDQIKAVTNQKSDASIERYNKRMNTAQKRKISEKITEGLRGTTANSCTDFRFETNTSFSHQISISSTREETTLTNPTLVIEKNGAKVSVYL